MPEGVVLVLSNNVVEAVLNTPLKNHANIRYTLFYRMIFCFGLGSLTKHYTYRSRKLLKDFLPSIKKSFDDRMTNPIVGAFTLSWCMANWKIFLILFFSDKAIEDKISVIEKSYTSLSTILYYPMFFTALYLVAFPWLLLFVQNVQEAAISRRKSKKIKEDVAYLKEKISLAEAESKFDEVKLKQQLMLDFEKKSKSIPLIPLYERGFCLPDKA